MTKDCFIAFVSFVRWSLVLRCDSRAQQVEYKIAINQEEGFKVFTGIKNFTESDQKMHKNFALGPRPQVPDSGFDITTTLDSVIKTFTMSYVHKLHFNHYLLITRSSLVCGCFHELLGTRHCVIPTYPPKGAPISLPRSLILRILSILPRICGLGVALDD